MEVQSKILKRGFSTNLLKDCSIEYPRNTWETLSGDIRKAITSNLLYLKVSPYSMFFEKIHFDFSSPHLIKLGDSNMLGDMPRIAEEDNMKTKTLIEKFNNKNISFKDTNKLSIKDIETEESAIIGMSFGKDSLLSYALAKEINLKPKSLMVQDFFDIEATHKLKLMKKFEKEFKEKIEIVYDEIDAMYSYKRINKTDSEGIINANAMNAYLTLLLPMAIKHRTKHIIFGNEQNFNDYSVNDEGFKVYPSYDQSAGNMIEQNIGLTELASGSFKVRSLIEPIYNIAEYKIFFNRYPEIAKYMMSCDHSKKINRKNRWCYSCPMCAKAFLFMNANNIDIKKSDFTEDFFKKEHKKFYPLFTKPTRLYEKTKEVRDEQLFAFYLAYKEKKKGYLIEKFKDQFLKEAKQREDELYNKFFKIHNAVSLTHRLASELKSIYKEELK